MHPMKFTQSSETAQRKVERNTDIYTEVEEKGINVLVLRTREVNGGNSRRGTGTIKNKRM